MKPDALETSCEVLRDGGSLSSDSVLFVLDKEQQRQSQGTRGVLLGFGPGLTFEGAVINFGGNARNRI